MKSFKRSERVSEQILREVSTYLNGDFSAKLPGMITITHVKLSKDLRYATVYFSYLGKDEGTIKIIDLLISEAGKIRYHLGKNMHIRHIPEITFKFDPSVKEGIKIEKLLDEINNQKE